MQVDKITTDEIKNAASGNFYQSLGNYQGVDVISSSALFQDINLRGFDDTRSYRTKQLIDGIDDEVPSLNFPLGNFNGVNDLDLESVELVSGPASTLYGPNAFQGLVSMNTKSPYDYQGVSLQVKGGAGVLSGAGQPYYDAQFRYAGTVGKSKRFAIKITGEYTRMKDWPLANDSLHLYGNNVSNVNLASQLQQEAAAPYCPTCPVTNSQHAYYSSLVNWLSTNGEALNFDPSEPTAGLLGVHPPGYYAGNFVDSTAQNAKASAGIYYRFKNDVQLSITYRFGFSTGIYDASTQYQMQDFYFHQPAIEAKGKNFFMRAYTTIENSGSSYSLGATGADISLASIPDYTTRFRTAYFNAIDSIVGGFQNCPSCFTGNNNQWILDSARQIARAQAQAAFLQPGSTAFNDTLNRVINGKNPLSGSELNSRSALVHVEGQYDWDFVKWLNISTGASYRIYIPNSGGTIFADTSNVKLREQQIGAYLQAAKKLFHDNFQIIGSIRADKNSNFLAQVSPRGSLVYTYRGKRSDHTFRVVAATSFRTPTLQQEYAYLNLGPMYEVGNLSGMSNIYTLNSASEAFALNSQSPQGTISEQAAQALVPLTLNPLHPEHLTSIEFGYRADIEKRVLIDLTGYYSIYNGLIGYSRVVAPVNVSSGDSLNRINILSGNYTALQTWANANGNVPAWGASISMAYYVGRGITPYINYTYAAIDETKLADNSPNILSGFNTPPHKVNVGVNAQKVFAGLGFSVNWRWVQTYQWQGPFGDGTIPAYHTLDMQIFYEVRKAYSTIRIGGSNIYNSEHIEAIGAPTIGALYYLGWTFDFSKLQKKQAVHS
jgi:outer membrane receptor protein involved in Fe transport